ncbi:hypothetical protein GCM10020295_80800 [Streptomyces cinereospinus]
MLLVNGLAVASAAGPGMGGAVLSRPSRRRVPALSGRLGAVDLGHGGRKGGCPVVEPFAPVPRARRRALPRLGWGPGRGDDRSRETPPRPGSLCYAVFAARSE